MQSPRRSSLPAGGGYSYDDDDDVDVDVDALAPPPSLIEDLRNIFAMLNDEEFESEVQIERSRRDAEKKPAASASIKKSAAAGPPTKKKTSPRHALPLARAEMTTTPQNINTTATTTAAAAAAVAASILPMDEDQPVVAEQSPATAAVFPPSAKKKQTKQLQQLQQKSVEDESWNTSFIPLQQFKQKYGHVTLPHPAEDATHANLYSWIAVATQICQGRLASNGGGSSSSSATTSSSSALTAEQQQLHDIGLPVPAPSPAAAPVTAKVDKARAKREQAAAAAAHVATTSRRSLRERTATKSKEYGDHAGAHAASATKAASKSAAAVVAKVKNPMPKPSSKATAKAVTPQKKKKQRVAAPVTTAATVATTTKQRLNQEQMWDLSCEKLRKFKKVAGHVDVPPQHSLFKWLLRQRLQWRYALQGLRSTMTENRIQRLSQLGVVPAQPPTVAQVVVAAAQLLDPTNTDGKRTAPDHDDDDCIGGPTSNKKHKNDHTDTNKSMNQHNLMPATAGSGAHPPPHFPLQPTLTFPLGPLPGLGMVAHPNVTATAASAAAVALPVAVPQQHRPRMNEEYFESQFAAVKKAAEKNAGKLPKDGPLSHWLVYQKNQWRKFLNGEPSCLTQRVSTLN
jgi:Helicase associated domain